MMKRLLLILSLVVLVLSTAWAPTTYKKFTLNIHNNTEDDVKVKLEGDETYNFTVKPGKSTKEVQEGEYEYSFRICNYDNKTAGTIVVDSNDVWLKIPKCPKGDPVETKFVINYHIDQPITVELRGDKDYDLQIELGKNKFEQIMSGTYLYAYEVCDAVFAGELRIEKNGKTQMTIKSCERLAYMDFEKPAPVKLRVANHLVIPLDLTLIGPLTYFQKVQPGLNRVQVVAGTYTYIYAAYGKRYEGTFTVRKGGTTILALPYFKSADID